MRTTNVICKSNVIGSRKHLQEDFKSFEEFEAYCDTYNNHARLGYKTPEDAWNANPWIECSVEPSDYRAVTPSIVALESINYYLRRILQNIFKDKVEIYRHVESEDCEVVMVDGWIRIKLVVQRIGMLSCERICFDVSSNEQDNLDTMDDKLCGDIPTAIDRIVSLLAIDAAKQEIDDVDAEETQENT